MKTHTVETNIEGLEHSSLSKNNPSFAFVIFLNSYRSKQCSSDFYQQYRFAKNRFNIVSLKQGTDLYKLKYTLQKLKWVPLR